MTTVLSELASYVALLIRDFDDTRPNMALDRRLQRGSQACLFPLRRLG